MKMIYIKPLAQKILGAGMDVFVTEPPESNHPFLS